MVLLLVCTAGVTALLGVRYYRRRRWWTNERLDMTNDLVERMLGHRTRLAQQARSHWNEGEDQALERYLRASEALDQRTAVLLGLVPRGWHCLVCILARRAAKADIGVRKDSSG